MFRKSKHEVVSHNVRLTAKNNADLAVQTASNKLLLSNRWATLIYPEYTGVYNTGLQRLMGGLVIESSLRNQTDQDIPGPSIFGFNVCTSSNPGGKQSPLVIPNIDKSFLPAGIDPMDALDGFHARLITTTNEALHALGSPYRLAELDLGLPIEPHLQGLPSEKSA